MQATVGLLACIAHFCDLRGRSLRCVPCPTLPRLVQTLGERCAGALLFYHVVPFLVLFCFIFGIARVEGLGGLRHTQLPRVRHRGTNFEPARRRSRGSHEYTPRFIFVLRASVRACACTEEDILNYGGAAQSTGLYLRDEENA